MALGQQNGCHVMLDTGALGPKDMDSLGLSLFQPDFIINSFYWVFGSDPTGFGCLLIKKSVRERLESDPGRDSNSDRDGPSTIFEETDNISVGESPLGSEKSGQFKKGKLGSPLPSSWFTGTKGNKRMSPNLPSRISRSPLYDGNVISFDVVVL
ncbi:Molybdenum cofactor sulfurase [Hordeum vulgare]|nr:Molybdenum cofactor sulfurase [Hordeum vulgare]